MQKYHLLPSRPLTHQFHHRAALQKKLKESATKRRAEKALAKKQATQLLRDKSKLAAELQKFKRAAEKRALVLRRKAAEAIQKQKQLAELQRKKKNAMNVRLNRFEMASSMSSNSSKARKEELLKWLEREIETGAFLRQAREAMEDQIDAKREAEVKREQALARGDRDGARILQKEIDTRGGVISQHEKTIESVIGVVAAASTAPTTFVDNTTWSGVSRSSELRVLFTMTFERLLTTMKDNEERNASHKIHEAVNDAISKQKRKYEDQIMKLKMEHGETVMTLLESTNTAVEKKINEDLTEITCGAGMVDDSVKQSVDDMLREYFEPRAKVEEKLKEELKEVKDTQDGMKAMQQQMADGLFVLKKKKPKKKAENNEKEHMKMEEFFDEEDTDDDTNEDEEDSDYDPGQDKQQERKTKRRNTMKEDP